MEKQLGWAVMLIAAVCSSAAGAAEDLVLVEPALPGTTITGQFEHALNDRFSLVGGVAGSFSIQSYAASFTSGNISLERSQTTRTLSAELEAGPNWYLLGHAFDGLWIGARLGAGWNWIDATIIDQGTGLSVAGPSSSNGWSVHGGGMIGYTQPLAKSLHVSMAAELLGMYAPSTSQGPVTSTTTQWSIAPRVRFGLGWAF